MKRLSFIVLFLMAVALTATAQVTSYYGETYEKETGKTGAEARRNKNNSTKKLYP